ncbi:hypothetical protein F443_00781 [Phytophthora nicotianae P1569]|uniref:HAT C-terminal dimerisation domain-containing protein n=1 Tax=Phytophthora nicotianae P1569 TaxID=1317065 RepID=V9FZC5_PHYNI|nr:hypothetical protein F443_00781 [Phytophthora nicotianae P1569]
MKNIVVTVPAYFNDSQADSLHHRVRPEQDGRRAQRADLRLGGGISDMSLLNTEEGIFLVKATAGDTHLDGEDSDNRLVENFVQEFKPHHRKDLTHADVHQDRLAVRRHQVQLDQHARALREPVQRRLPHDEGTRGEGSACLIAAQEPVARGGAGGHLDTNPQCSAADGVLNVEKPYHSSNPDKAVVFGAKKQASTLIFNTPPSNQMSTLTAQVAALLDQNLTLDALDNDSTTMVEKAVELSISMQIITADDEDAFHKVLQTPKRFSAIKPFATRILSIPTFSASSERNWSIHGFIHTKTRNRLFPDRVNKPVFVYCNLGATSEVNHIMYELFPEACDENDSSDDEADAEERVPIRIRSPVNVEQTR